MLLLKVFLVAWTPHFGSVWFEEVTRQLVNEMTDIILQHCKFIQIRLAKAWGSVISAYVMVSLYVIFKVIHFTLGETNIKASRGQASHSQKSATFPFDKSAKNVKDNGPKTK